MSRRLTVWNPWAILPEDSFNLDPFRNDLDDVSMDIYEEGDNVFVEVKASGFEKDDIKIQIESNVITVNGSIKKETEENLKNRKYYRKEIKSLSFSRTAELPSLVNADGAKAVFKNGMLKITLPKREEAKPKSISVNVE